jgi:hypothetical protein
MLQEYLAAGVTLTHEQSSSHGYGLKTACAAGVGPTCTVYTGGRTDPHDLIGAVLQTMIGVGSDIDGVTLLALPAWRRGLAWFMDRPAARCAGTQPV